MKHLFTIMLTSMVLIFGECSYEQPYYAGKAAASSITAKELRCEYAVNPLGIDTPQPRFSWILESNQRAQMQSAYHVLVASSAEKLRSDIGDKWDSGKVASEKSVNVPHEGRALSSGEKCYWKVRVWDKNGKASPWSKPTVFEMGLLKESDWQGEWIGQSAPEKVLQNAVEGKDGRPAGVTAAWPAPLLRKEFEISGNIKQARVYISGLGWSELYINGKKVGDHVLDPATTDYKKRILYVTYDVSDMLSRGTNALGVMLGNGWYCEPGRLRYGDSPRLLLQMNIEYADGTSKAIKTDPSWKVAAGPITRNNLWGGETYDARQERKGWKNAGYDDSNWANAVLKSSPGGKMVSQLMPAIKVNQTIKPVKLTNPKPGIHVYDMGQLFGGWARLRLKGPRGTKVTIKYSARVFEDSGLLDKRRHRRRGNETDYYILKGDPKGETYEPRFTYHPVRYVQIEGYPGKPTINDLEGRVVFSAVDMSGDFSCSNPLLNQIHKNVVWTLTNGLFGMPLDCLHREHWAWTDPATVTGNLYPRKYMPLFWTKWLGDIKDAQRKDGAVPNICPKIPLNFKSYPIDRSDPAWGGNYPLLVWYLYQYYEDECLLKEHYEGMKRWLEYLASISDNHIVVKGYYGDHMLPGLKPGEEQFISTETPKSLVWTGYYYRGAYVVSQVAKILAKTDDARRYAQLAEDIKDAFNKKWLNKDTNFYAAGSQTANFLPLALGIIPEANEKGVVQSLVKDIIEKYKVHHHTGNTGTTCMIDILTEHGYGDIMYGIATQTSYPGWGYMLAQGATTIWENWGLGQDAESMVMWCTIDEFFYNDLTGINGPDYYGSRFIAPGFKQIEIKPHVLGDLTYASGSIKTVRGMVSSNWKRTDDSFILEVSIPVNSEAKVSVPKIGLKNAVVSESGKTIYKAGRFIKGVPGITAGSESENYVTFDIGCGSYAFQLIGQQ